VRSFFTPGKGDQENHLSNETGKTVAELLAPMLKKTLFVAISRVAAPASAIEPFVGEHLAYMDALEAEGRLWASGPFIEEGVLVGDGLTILSTGTIDEAPGHGREAAYQARAPHVRTQKWELREGPIDISRHASVNRYSL
jgi:uncharacterized protein